MKITKLGLLAIIGLISLTASCSFGTAAIHYRESREIGASQKADKYAGIALGSAALSFGLTAPYLIRAGYNDYKNNKEKK